MVVVEKISYFLITNCFHHIFQKTKFTLKKAFIIGNGSNNSDLKRGSVIEHKGNIPEYLIIPSWNLEKIVDKIFELIQGEEEEKILLVDSKNGKINTNEIYKILKRRHKNVFLLEYKNENTEAKSEEFIEIFPEESKTILFDKISEVQGV